MGKALCGVCRKIIKSTYRHDYVSCGCPNQTSIDGGDDYTKVGGANLEKVFVWNEKKKKFICCVGSEEIGFDTEPDSSS